MKLCPIFLQIFYTFRANLHRNLTIISRSCQSPLCRSQYFIVYYIEPVETNRVALGYDIGSETVSRLPAITLALESLQPRVTARLKLVQSTFNEYGWLYLLPMQIYQTLAYQKQCLNFTYTLDSPPLQEMLDPVKAATVWPKPSTCGFPAHSPWSDSSESSRSYGPDYIFGMISAVLKPSILLKAALDDVHLPDMDVVLFDSTPGVPASSSYLAFYRGQEVNTKAPTDSQWNFDTYVSDCVLLWFEF
jgi:hypothetical protein